MTMKRKIILLVTLITVGSLFIDDKESVQNRLQPHYSGYDYFIQYFTYTQLRRPIPS